MIVNTVIPDSAHSLAKATKGFMHFEDVDLLLMSVPSMSKTTAGFQHKTKVAFNSRLAQETAIGRELTSRTISKPLSSCSSAFI